MIYLDNNATTPTLPEIRDTILAAMSPALANPSSAHPAGENARIALLKAREQLAMLLGSHPEQLTFTSGATEANNLVLSLLLTGQRPKKLVTSSTEHSSVLKYAEFLEEQGVAVTYLPVDRTGRISLRDVKDALSPAVGLVSLHWINNETGVVQPIHEIATLCKEQGVPFHTDAAQAAGKIPISLENSEIDFLSLTGHKFHAPPGVGALYARDKTMLRPLLRGGPQEDGLRPGTENVPGIVALGKAAALRHEHLEETIEKLTKLRDLFERTIVEKVPDVHRNGHPEYRACNTSNLRFTGLDGQALVIRLGQEGVYCSQSSACTNQRPEPSYVLRAMQLSEQEAYESIRFSFGQTNTEEEVLEASGHLVRLCEILRTFGS